MISRTVLPWLKIDDFLLDCGKICHPKKFSIHLLEKLDSLIPYDEGMVWFFDDTGAVIDEFLLNMDPQIIWNYKEYYSKIDGGRYSISMRARKKRDCNRMEEYACDWIVKESDEFVTDHIKPQGIRYIFDLGLYDINGSLRSACVMNRIRRVKYSDAEMAIMETVLPHLRNLYRNLFFDMAESGASADSALSCLTSRESKIVALLCKSIGPTLIGQKLFISRPTVYRHIANIYNKLGISSIQELVVRAYNHPAALQSIQA